MTNDKKAQIISFLQTIDRLEILPRTGYFFAGIRQPESIAAHAYGVVITAMVLADLIDETVDAERVMRLAILHDATEAALTDIPHSILKYLGGENKNKAEAKAAADLLGSIDETYHQLWLEFQAGETIEARIVNAADKLQMIIKITAYERAGTGNFDEFWTHMRKFKFHGIGVARELFEHIISTIKK